MGGQLLFCGTAAPRSFESAVAMGTSWPRKVNEAGDQLKQRLVTRAAVAVIAALALAVPAAASPALAAKDNAAIAINTKDGSSLFRFAFSVHRTMNQVIEETNIAVAYASCEACQTVAIAIQIVIVSSDPDAIAPQNVAFSINEQCISCDTMADAYQFVVGGSGFELTKEGRKRIKEIRKAFYDLAKEAEKEGLTNAEIRERLLPLVEEIRVVLSDHVVPADTSEEEGEEDDESGEEDGPNAERTTEPTASPSAEATESPSPTPSATSITTPTPTAST